MFVSLFIVIFFIWLILTNSFAVSKLIVGFIASLTIAGFFKKYSFIRFDRKILLRILLFAFIYIPVLTWEMIKANIDVARRVLTPSLPLYPGFVKVKTDLKGNISKLTLANSITLTPGTLTLDVEEDTLYVHWIDVKSVEEEEKKKRIVGRFERILKGVFE